MFLNKVKKKKKGVSIHSLILLRVRIELRTSLLCGHRANHRATVLSLHVYYVFNYWFSGFLTTLCGITL